MAQGPKSTKTPSQDAPAKETKARASKTTSKTAKEPIEDAEVVGETPPPAKAETAKTAAKPERAPVELAEPAKPTRAAATSKATPAEPQKSDTKPKDTPKTAAGDTTKPAKTPDEATGSEPPAAQAPRRGGGVGRFLGLLLGGAAAAVIGFVAARTVVPEGWPFPGVAPEEDPLVGQVEAQSAEIAGLGDQLASLEATLAEVQSDTSGVDALRADMTARLDGIEATFGEISDRLDAVEKLAPEGSAAAEAAAAAYDRELQALREMFEGELAKVEAAQADAAGLQAQAAEAERAAAGRAALSTVATALDTGAPFSEALDELTAATGVTVPDALTAKAADGVPTLAALQADFAPAARDAIDADIRARVEDGSISRAQAFLQTQLGTRSLEPREGDTADAVLSRAEAALKSGDLATTLAELDALPEAAAPAMAAWRTQAEARVGALAASAAMAQELNAK